MLPKAEITALDPPPSTIIPHHKCQVNFLNTKRWHFKSQNMAFKCKKWHLTYMNFQKTLFAFLLKMMAF